MICISCGIFKEEILLLQKQKKLDMEFRFLDSSLHMDPQRLKDELDHAIEAELTRGERIVLIYGDCHSHIIDSEAHPDIVRVGGVNCCSILLGEDRYRELRTQEAFFLLPEWTRRWREIFQKEIGFKKEDVPEIMAQSHRRIIYLDTGVIPVPVGELKACSDFCNLPWEIMEISLDLLCESINEAAGKFNTLEYTDEYR